MKKICRNAARGYMQTVEPFNECWSYLFICEWRRSTRDASQATILLVLLILTTPFAYLCVAPIVAFIEVMKEEG